MLMGATVHGPQRGFFRTFRHRILFLNCYQIRCGLVHERVLKRPYRERAEIIRRRTVVADPKL